jgi:hypothetical protein
MLLREADREGQLDMDFAVRHHDKACTHGGHQA